MQAKTRTVGEAREAMKKDDPNTLSKADRMFIAKVLAGTLVVSLFVLFLSWVVS